MGKLSLETLSSEQKDLARQIGDEAVKIGIDPDLAIAQAFQESGIKQFTGDGKEKKVLKSDSDAYGIMQVTPNTAKSIGYTKEDLDNPETNIRVGLTLMKNYLDKYEAPDLALMAYHQGEPTVDKYLEKKDLSILGPKGKDYVLSIGSNYDFNKSGLTEEVNHFAPIEPLPEHIKNWNPPSTSEPNIIDKTGQTILQNPEIPLIGGSAGWAQHHANVNHYKRTATPTASNAPVDLEAQFKEQQNANLTSGDKWNKKVVGSLGPGADSSTEAARNYQTQKALNEAKLGSQWQVNREGIIRDPLALENERRMNLAKEIMKNQSPVQRVLNATKQVSGMPKTLGGSSLGRNSLATGMSAMNAVYNLEEARRREQEGDMLGAKIANLNAYSSALAAIPIVANPLALTAKGLGIAGEVGLTTADYLRQQFFPHKSVIPLANKKP